jgi:hypothetical protein
MTWLEKREEERLLREQEEDERERREQLTEYLLMRAEEAERRRKREIDEQIKILDVHVLTRFAIPCVIPLAQIDKEKIWAKSRLRVRVELGDLKIPVRFRAEHSTRALTGSQPVVMEGYLRIDESGDLILAEARFATRPWPGIGEEKPWQDQVYERLK